jgi:hypothetical protein
MLNRESSYVEDVGQDRPTILKMLTVEAQLMLKMDPRSEIATPSFQDPWASSCHTYRSGRVMCRER